MDFNKFIIFSTRFSLLIGQIREILVVVGSGRAISILVENFFE